MPRRQRAQLVHKIRRHRAPQVAREKAFDHVERLVGRVFDDALDGVVGSLAGVRYDREPVISLLDRHESGKSRLGRRSKKRAEFDIAIDVKKDELISKTKDEAKTKLQEELKKGLKGLFK